MRVATYSISPAHYNDIPDDILQGEKTVLEFGCASGINLLISRHRDFFIKNNKEGRYLGVDLEPPDDLYLNIQQGDIRDYSTDIEYDVVIALHVLEHIDIKYWAETVDRLKSFVAHNGYLIIGTPNDEPDGTHEGHLVCNITADMLRKYLRGGDVREIKTPFKFNENGAGFAWSLLRYMKRRLTGHAYVRRAGRLLAIWQKVEQ